MPSSLFSRFTGHPLWLVGFRPFFALACLAGAILPLIWILLFSGSLTAPPDLALPPVQWHGHEMFYGFGWAMLGGFLLTASKNWVGVRGYHGAALVFLVAAWLFERVGMAFGGAWPQPMFVISNTLFLAAVVALLLWTLIRHRAQDSYRDNVYFWLALPLFLLAKLLVFAHFAAGWSMTLALFRLAFLIMLERTLTQFMKGVFQLALPRHAPLDHGIKALALLLAFSFVLPTGLASYAALLLALLLGVRWLLWSPRLALRRLDVGIMYLGHLAIIAQLVVEFFGPSGAGLVGTVSVHLFTFGVMGLITPAMVVRIARGHTGRKVIFESLDKAALYLMLAGLLLRVLLPQLVPTAYLLWMSLAAGCWLACFSLLTWRYLPFLLQARVDGKEH